MNGMRKLIHKNRYFFVPYLLFVISSLFLMTTFDKPDLHILFNRLHSPFLDSFFKQLTYLGDGMIYFLILAILLFYNYRWSIVFTTAVLASSFFVIMGKRSFFPDAYRPTKYFELYQNYHLHVVKGVNLHSLHSFPSGHTTTAFTLFIMLAFLVRSNALKLLCFFIAVLTGFSRIYLSQHFLIDVFTGSIIGTGCVLLSWHYFDRFNSPWLEKSILLHSKLRRKKHTPKALTKMNYSAAKQTGYPNRINLLNSPQGAENKPL